MEYESPLWINYLPIITRSSERLLIVIGGLLGIYFGYALFRLGVIVDQSASGEFRSFKISLGRVGPGTFFALFGSALLAYSLASPVTVQNSEGAPRVQFAQGNPEQNLIPALNALNDLVEADGFSTPRFYPEANLTRALRSLSQVRDAYITERFGRANYQRYLDERDLFLSDPRTFSQEDRELLGAIHRIYSARFDQ